MHVRSNIAEISRHEEVNASHTTLTEGTCRCVFMFSSSTASSCNTLLHAVSSHSLLFISFTDTARCC